MPEDLGATAQFALKQHIVLTCVLKKGLGNRLGINIAHGARLFRANACLARKVHNS